MLNYAAGVPIGNNGTGMTGLVAPLPAVNWFAKENGTASSVVSLSNVTTAIEIAAVGGPAAMRWVKTSDTEGSVVATAAGANFDHIIPTGQFRRFVVPLDPSITTHTFNSTGSLGANLANNLYQRVAFKSLGIASVLTTEY